MIHENNGKNLNLGELIVGAGLFYGGFKLLEKLFGESHDTVNYKLKHKGKLVYHGICYEDRLETRLYEHECSGKRFDECIYDEAKPRTTAKRLEQRRIMRDRPRYNNHHNF